MNVNSTLVANVAAEHKLSAEWLTQPTDWMAGAIKGHMFRDDVEREAFARAVIASIEPVAPQEQPYSTCTDGRKRQNLLDGALVPVREQMVGTDVMSAFVAAEALGERFYGGDLYAPVAARIERVVRFLADHGYKPSAHLACGAAGSFTTVLNRSTQFIDSPAYIQRLQALLPAGVYDETLHQLIVGSYQSRLDSDIYEGYKDGLVCDIVTKVSGQHAVECLVDDGIGVHGHQEQAIVYLDASISHCAINTNKLMAEHAVQVFAVNSGREEELARLFGGADDMDYRTARLAIEDFAASGHGTLAYTMETVIIRGQ